MATLRGRSPNMTYGGSLRVEATGLTEAMQQMEDGFGNYAPIHLSKLAVKIHNLTFPATNAAPGKILAVALDGTSMEWIDVPNNKSTSAEVGSLQVSNGSMMVDLPIGNNGQVLMVDKTKPTGLKWSTIETGSSQDLAPDSTTYQYNANDAISIMTETIKGNDRVSTYHYNQDGTINTIEISYMGITRIESYTYTNGRVSSMSSNVI